MRDPISSCETLLGLREFLPYFRAQSMDVAIVDAVWNGVWQSVKIAAAADAYAEAAHRATNVAERDYLVRQAARTRAHTVNEEE